MTSPEMLEALRLIDENPVITEEISKIAESLEPEAKRIIEDTND